MTITNKRDRIIEATVTLLIEQGLLSVQTRAVTERAGVGTGLLNHYFRWPDLRATAWVTIFNGVADEMWRDGEIPSDAMHRFFTESFGADARPFWRLWIEAEGLVLQDSVMADAVTSARCRLRDALTEILAKGVSRGDWALDAPRVTALRLEAMRDGLAALLLGADADVSESKAEAHLRDLFWRETRQH
jgi:hypothetical protein